MGQTFLRLLHNLEHEKEIPWESTWNYIRMTTKNQLHTQYICISIYIYKLHFIDDSIMYHQLMTCHKMKFIIIMNIAFGTQIKLARRNIVRKLLSGLSFSQDFFMMIVRKTDVVSGRTIFTLIPISIR